MLRKATDPNFLSFWNFTDDEKQKSVSHPQTPPKLQSKNNVFHVELVSNMSYVYLTYVLLYTQLKLPDSFIALLLAFWVLTLNA